MKNKKVIQVSVYAPNTPKNEVLTTNGDAILDNIVISWETLENLFTGNYTLDLVSIIDKEGLHEFLKEEAILKVRMDYGDEVFKVAKVNKSNRDIRVFARQITIEESLNMWLIDVRPTNTSGQGALSILKNNSVGSKDIEFFSDIDTINTAYYMDMSVYEALHNCDQSFMNRWGGEILRRGYTVTINNKIGADRGVQIRSGKNLTGFDAKTDIDKVVTRIVAKGFDGIRAKNFIDSPLINSYSSIKTKEIKYDFVKVKNENNPEEGFTTLEEAQAELERLAKLEFSQNHIDELRAEYDINYIQLEKTEEYKNFVQAERCYLGDIVNVFEEKHNIDIHVRCFEKKFDGKRQKVEYMKLTNTDINQKTITTTDILAELNSIIKNTNNNNVQDIVQSMINSGIKDSYVIPRQNEIIVADNKDLNLAMNVVRINKNGMAFSQDGYYGTYKYGFTINGVINASLIATGILSTIMIQNKDGSLQIDLSGTKGINFLKHGVRSIEIAGNILRFYDWDGEGDPIGEVYSSRLNGSENVPGLVMANKSGSYLSLGYEKNGQMLSYMRYDKDNIDGTTDVPITIFEDIEFKNALTWIKYGINAMYNSSSNNLVYKCLNDFIIANGVGESPSSRFKSAANYLAAIKDDLFYFMTSPEETYFANGRKLYALFKVGECFLYNGDRSYAKFSESESFMGKNGKRYASFSEDETYLCKNGYKYASFKTGAFEFWDNMGNGYFFVSTTNNLVSNLKFFANNGMHVKGDFTVSGNKNCIQSTQNYGDRKFYSVEDCESYLTDRSMHLLTVEEVTKDNKTTYERVILLDNIFKESVNLDIDYTIEVIKQGWGDYRIKEQTKDYFIVESDRPDFMFKYVITAKRKGFEDERNNEVFLDAETYSLDDEIPAHCEDDDNIFIDDINNIKDTTPEYWRLYAKNKII